MRAWLRPARWLPLMIAAGGFYLLLLVLISQKSMVNLSRQVAGRQQLKSEYDYTSEDNTKPVTETPSFVFTFNSTQYPEFSVVDVLTHPDIAAFQERMSADYDINDRKRLIVSYDAGHTKENMNGCPDWHCEFTIDRSRADEADVILTQSSSYKRARPEQIIAYFSQESPRNMGTAPSEPDYYNVSLGFRHDTAGASPYGYTVKLAEKRQLEKVLNITRVQGKNKTAAWFVSHCATQSKREDLVKRLQLDTTVDVYGPCYSNGLKCPRGSACEDMLDTDYHFYMALENSVCTDYITEKVWNQGYGRDIVPIVLKRSIVEGRLPPNSFIAVDDFDTVRSLAEHMNYLVKNTTAYLEYFKWKEDYQTVYLNGATHDVLERPWGFCQLCRLAWEKDKKVRIIKDFRKWWDGSCEPDGQTVDTILRKSDDKERMLRGNRIDR